MNENRGISEVSGSLRRITLLPLALLALAISVTFAAVLVRQHRQRSYEIQSLFVRSVEEQRSYLSSELLLGRTDAIEYRLERVLSDWETNYPGTRPCLSVVANGTVAVAAPIRRCASEGAAHPDVQGTTKLFAGDASLGAVHYALSLPLALTLSGFLGLSATFVLLLILAFVLNLFLLRRVERTMLVPLVDRLVAERRKAAVVEVARMVAHDIRRPFQTLLASLRMLPIESLGPSAALVRRIAADVELNARGVSAMLDDVLSSDGKTKLNLERVEVRGLVESILAEMNAQTVARGVSWSIDVDTKLSFIADPLRMRRALANLIENAGHAVRPNGTAAILANAINEPGTIRIVVSNEGEPIPESVRERLFREPVSTKSLGSGVGLLSTKRVVEAHGGTIRCESEDGETRFIIDLPQPAFAESVFKDDGFSRLVVFDDDESIQQLFRQLGELQVGKPLSIYRDWEAMLASGSFELIEGACLVIDMQYRGSRFDGVAIARQGRRLGAVHLFAFTSDPATAEASGAFDRVYSKDQAHDLMRDLQSLSGKMSGCPVPDNPDNR